MEKPKHANSQKAGQTLLFSGSDTETNYKKHIKDPVKLAYIQERGWETIKYTYNSDGFRDEEFDDRPCCIAFGCSFTEGTGLLADETWPHYASKALGMKVWNLGALGESLDTVYRLAEYYVPLLNPKYVFVLGPPQARIEWYNVEINQHFSLQPNISKTVPRVVANVLMNDQWQEVNRRKTLNALSGLIDVPWFFKNHNNIISPNFKSKIYYNARDFSHNGPEYQQAVAKYFKERI